jgi:hypothetical protein
MPGKGPGDLYFSFKNSANVFAVWSYVRWQTDREERAEGQLSNASGGPDRRPDLYWHTAKGGWRPQMCNPPAYFVATVSHRR